MPKFEHLRDRGALQTSITVMLGLFLCAFASGSAPEDWLSDPPFGTIFLSRDRIDSSGCFVDQSQVQHTEAMLKDSAFLEITQEQANDLTRGCVTPSSPDRPYLLRALEVEGPPGSHTEVSIFLKTTGDLLVGMETSDTQLGSQKGPMW